MDEQSELRALINQLDQELINHHANVLKEQKLYSEKRLERQRLSRKLRRLRDVTNIERSGSDTIYVDITSVRQSIKDWLNEFDETIRILSDRSGVSTKTIYLILNEKRQWYIRYSR